jgi:antitoxin component of MazEF toxin-antitoxin module
MSLLKIEDGSNVKLPKEIVESLGLRKGAIVSVRVEGNRIILRNVMIALLMPVLASGLIRLVAPVTSKI